VLAVREVGFMAEFMVEFFVDHAKRDTHADGRVRCLERASWMCSSSMDDDIGRTKDVH